MAFFLSCQETPRLAVVYQMATAPARRLLSTKCRNRRLPECLHPPSPVSPLLSPRPFLAVSTLKEEGHRAEGEAEERTGNRPKQSQTGANRRKQAPKCENLTRRQHWAEILWCLCRQAYARLIPLQFSVPHWPSAPCPVHRIQRNAVSTLCALCWGSRRRVQSSHGCLTGRCVDYPDKKR